MKSTEAVSVIIFTQDSILARGLSAQAERLTSAGEATAGMACCSVACLHAGSVNMSRRANTSSPGVNAFIRLKISINSGGTKLEKDALFHIQSLRLQMLLTGTGMAYSKS
jgi:hypothetical protein